MVKEKLKRYKVQDNDDRYSDHYRVTLTNWVWLKSIQQKLVQEFRKVLMWYHSMLISIKRSKWQKYFWCYIKQIMNVFHSCDGTYIFIRWKMKCSIQFGLASLNRTFHLSPHENISTTAFITIHNLYMIERYELNFERAYSVPLNHMYKYINERLKQRIGQLRAGVCRPCDTIELTATSCNFSLCRRVEKVCVDRQLLRYSWSRS